MNEPYRVARILVPIDGSEFSRYAAEVAVRLAVAYGSELLFLHVVDNQVVDALAHEHADGERQVRERLSEQGHIYLKDVARLADEYGLAHRESVEEGDPCAAICDTAVHNDVDLIVMGKIGRRGARRILVGSITRGVIECSDRAVLVITGPPRQPLPPSQD